MGSHPKSRPAPRVSRPPAPEVPSPGKYCKRARKQKYNSKASALRAGSQRYGTTSNAYECKYCGKWHLTRLGVPANENDEQLDYLVDVALGKVGLK